MQFINSITNHVRMAHKPSDYIFLFRSTFFPLSQHKLSLIYFCINLRLGFISEIHRHTHTHIERSYKVFSVIMGVLDEIERALNEFFVSLYYYLNATFGNEAKKKK